MNELRMYTTLVGDLPRMVEKGEGKCFVEYDQYEELEKAYKQLVEKEYTEAHRSQFYD